MSASSLTVKITGITVSARASPATTALSRKVKPKAVCSQVAITISPKKPSTTEGMPASSSMVGLSTSRRRRGANSEEKTAAATPTGTATAMATVVTLSVPAKSGTIEYLGTSPTGCQVKVAARPARQTCGRNMRARSVSLASSGLVKSGSASRATKTKMRTTAAIPVSGHERDAELDGRLPELPPADGGGPMAAPTADWRE